MPRSTVLAVLFSAVVAMSMAMEEESGINSLAEGILNDEMAKMGLGGHNDLGEGIPSPHHVRRRLGECAAQRGTAATRQRIPSDSVGPAMSKSREMASNAIANVLEGVEGDPCGTTTTVVVGTWAWQGCAKGVCSHGVSM